MKKRTYLLLTVFILVVIDFCVNPDRIMLDGFTGEIAGLFLKTDTVFSSGYSHYKFNRLKTGMSETEVIDIIGPPLAEWRQYENNRFHPDKQQYITYLYSQSPSSINYRLRQVSFDRGRVAELKAYFYFD